MERIIAYFLSKSDLSKPYLRIINHFDIILAKIPRGLSRFCDSADKPYEKSRIGYAVIKLPCLFAGTKWADMVGAIPAQH